MFPGISLNITGLNPTERYCVLLEFAPTKNRRHKYIESSQSYDRPSWGTDSIKEGEKAWYPAGPAEPQSNLENRIFIHPDSAETGAHWMAHPVDFTKLKFTNSPPPHPSHASTEESKMVCICSSYYFPKYTYIDKFQF